MANCVGNIDLFVRRLCVLRTMRATVSQARGKGWEGQGGVKEGEVIPGHMSHCPTSLLSPARIMEISTLMVGQW